MTPGTEGQALPLRRLVELANRDPWLVHRGRFLDVTFLVGASAPAGTEDYLVRIRRGRVDEVERGPFVMPRWTFALRADAQSWRLFFQPVPPPGFHDVLALVKSRRLLIDGDQHPFMANLLYFKDLLACLRPRDAQGAP